VWEFFSGFFYYMDFKLFNVEFKGFLNDFSKDELRDSFEYNTNTNNSNIFLFRSEIGAMVSIIKRFAVYFVAVLFLSSYFFNAVFLFVLENSFFIPIVYFVFFILVFLLFLLVILYILNSFFTLGYKIS